MSDNLPAWAMEQAWTIGNLTGSAESRQIAIARALVAADKAATEREAKIIDAKIADVISKDINILTNKELDAMKSEAFQKGVERGKFEASSTYSEGPYARNCKNWEDGLCDTCGAQSQYFEVSADHKCEHFSKRAKDTTP